VVWTVLYSVCRRALFPRCAMKIPLAFVGLNLCVRLVTHNREPKPWPGKLVQFQVTCLGFNMRKLAWNAKLKTQNSKLSTALGFPHVHSSAKAVLLHMTLGC
jgi:hypothetical protein